MVRASLYTMQAFLPPTSLPPDIPIVRFWCLAITYAAHLKRRLISSRHKDSPYFLVFHKRPDYRQLHVFGAICNVIKDETNKLLPRGTQGLFMGYGNTTKAPLYFCHQTRAIHRSHHRIVNDASHRTNLENIFTSPSKDTPTFTPSTIHLDLMPTPFHNQILHTYEITIPHHATHAGFEIKDDTYFNIPYISKQSVTLQLLILSQLLIGETCSSLPSTKKNPSQHPKPSTSSNRRVSDLNQLSPFAFISPKESPQRNPNFKNYARPSIKFVLSSPPLLTLSLPLVSLHPLTPHN